MGTVTIEGSVRTINGTLAGADAWMAADPDLSGPWLNARSITGRREQLLVKATRLFNQLRWKGTKSNPSQPNAWPRDGATDPEGTAITNGTTPTTVEEATYQLAGMLSANPGLMAPTPGTQGQVRMVDDGRTKAEFHFSHAATKAAESTKSAMPRDVMEMIRGYLSRARVTAVTAESFGTDGESIFDDEEDGFGVSGGL